MSPPLSLHLLMKSVPLVLVIENSSIRDEVVRS
jgi:hypothetical protein